MLKGKRIMTVLAHPDDETLGCGGTLYRYRGSVSCLIPVRRIVNQCFPALSKLEVMDFMFGEFQDNRLDTYSTAQIAKFVEDGINYFGPEVIITHYDQCLNQDHRKLYEACVVATRPIKHRISLLSCEIPSSSGFLGAFHPNFYVELSSRDIEKKIEALQEYHTEARKSRSPEVIAALARVRGAESGYDYAEGFKIIRSYE